MQKNGWLLVDEPTYTQRIEVFARTRKAQSGINESDCYMWVRRWVEIDS